MSEVATKPEPTYSVSLTAAELVRLDGVCGAKTQNAVETAKAALAITAEDVSPHIAALVAAAIEAARKNGELSLSYCTIQYCPCCKRNDGYWPVKRTTQYKTKGQPDRDKPKMFRGTDLARGFIFIQGHVSVGGCNDCMEAAFPVLNRHLAAVPCALPDRWPSRPHHWMRYDNMQCSGCGWTGHEGQMKKRLTLMGNGHYPAGCPNCDKANQLFQSPIKHIDGFALIETPTPRAPEGT